MNLGDELVFLSIGLNLIHNVKTHRDVRQRSESDYRIQVVKVKFYELALKTRRNIWSVVFSRSGYYSSSAIKDFLPAIELKDKAALGLLRYSGV